MTRDWEAAEATLFTEWMKHLEPGGTAMRFYSDGLSRGSTYWESHPRVLFLLKEVNADKNSPAWNLFDVVGDGTIGPSWTVISYWTYGIHGGGLPWEQLPAADASSRRDAISKIAVVNLNKCGGGASSLEGNIWASAYRDRAFLIRQLRLYEPDIIIACGVGDIARHILFEEHWRPWQRASNGMGWLRPQGFDTLLVDGYHPQARLPHRQLYEHIVLGLKDIGAIGPPGQAP